MNQPIIGVTAPQRNARYGEWEAPATLLPHSYVRQLRRAGGMPLLVPECGTETDGVDRLVERLDGVVLSGGGDIHPGRYHADPHDKTDGVSVERDASEMALLKAAEQRGIPVLGICRGVQVLNVARGGSLHQHLPDLVGHDGHAPTPGAYSSHEIRVKSGSTLARLLGTDRATVPTHHHQAVADLGVGLEAVAWAVDGTVEAVEDPVARFVVGVQWHPEAGDDPSLFRSFVAAAAGLDPDGNSSHE